MDYCRSVGPKAPEARAQGRMKKGLAARGYVLRVLPIIQIGVNRGINSLCSPIFLHRFCMSIIKNVHAYPESRVQRRARTSVL